MNLLTWIFGKRELACQHKWKITGATYRPPSHSFKLYGDAFWSDRGQKLMEGFTRIFFQCEICGELKEEEHLGRFPVPGFKYK